MILPDDLDKLQTAHFHVQLCSGSVSGSVVLTLLAVLNLLVTRRLKRVGVFFSSEIFCMKCPSRGSASHWPTALHRFSRSPRSYEESALILGCRSHQKEGALHTAASRNTLASPYIHSDLLIFITIFPALSTAFEILQLYHRSCRTGSVTFILRWTLSCPSVLNLFRFQ